MPNICDGERLRNPIFKARSVLGFANRRTINDAAAVAGRESKPPKEPEPG